MVAWLLPVGLLVTVVLISVPGLPGILAALAWGWIVFPSGARLLRSHARSRGHGGDAGGLDDPDTNYWRIKLL
jgi:hypothetical protein